MPGLKNKAWRIGKKRNELESGGNKSTNPAGIKSLAVVMIKRYDRFFPHIVFKSMRANIVKSFIMRIKL